MIALVGIALCSSGAAAPAAPATPIIWTFRNADEVATGTWLQDTIVDVDDEPIDWVEAVQKALVDKYDQTRGALFFEVVQGFTPSQVGETPEAMGAGVIGTKILPMLDSADLPTRVLGSIALYELVEHRGAPYDPIETDRRDRRNRAVTRLENYLEKGELTVLAP